MIHLLFIHLVKSVSDLGPQGFWGSGFGSKFIVWGFREPCKKVKKNLTLKEKPSFCLIFFQKISSADPPWISKCVYFPANMLIWIVLMTDMAILQDISLRPVCNMCCKKHKTSIFLHFLGFWGLLTPPPPPHCKM